VSFSHVTLDMRDAREWRSGTLRLHREDGEVIPFATATFSALSAAGKPFSVSLIAPDGSEAGTFTAEAIVTGIPVSADCFVFSRRADGFWEGVTITVRSGRAAVVSYACDSS